MAKFKYVLLDRHSVPDADYTVEAKVLEDAGIECVIAECKSDDEVVEIAGDADAIGTIYYQLTPELISRLPNCKLMIRYGVGYDHINVDQATKQGIMVCNLPDYCRIDVATHTIALILDVCRKVTLHDRHLRTAGEWNDIYGYPVHRLEVLSLGFIGFGRLAQSTAKLAKAFDLKISAYDPFLPAEVFAENGVKQVELDEIYANSDIISIHVPLTDDTYHMIDEDSIAKMKDGVMIINTSRGGLISTDALCDGLKSGKIKAAGLDVLDEEPVNDTAFKLWEFDNVVVTPHTAYYSIESGFEQHQKVGLTVVDAFIKGVVPYNCVNAKELEKAK